MGCSDNFCSLCGISLNSPYDINKDQQWIYYCTILFNNNQNIHYAKEYLCNYFFKNKKQYDLWGVLPKAFIVIHTDCWKFIKQIKNIELKYSDFPVVDKLYNSSFKNHFFLFKINYKPISKYHGQEFDIESYLNDGYSLNSPLNNNKVLANLIINVFKQLNIKSHRVGPRVSATLYNNNDLLIGSDNNIWKISNSKWIKATDIKTYFFSSNIKVTDKNLSLLQELYNYIHYRFTYSNNFIKYIYIFNIPRFGQVSNCGLILKDINLIFTNQLCKINFII